jgi:hypothetical protein
MPKSNTPTIVRILCLNESVLSLRLNRLVHSYHLCVSNRLYWASGPADPVRQEVLQVQISGHSKCFMFGTTGVNRNTTPVEKTWPYCSALWSIQIIFKHWVRASKKTTTTINWLTLFKEIIAVYTENHMSKTQRFWMLKQMVLTVTTELWRTKIDHDLLLPITTFFLPTNQ